jgi:serine/threonine protein kinase
VGEGYCISEKCRGVDPPSNPELAVGDEPTGQARDDIGKVGLHQLETNGGTRHAAGERIGARLDDLSGIIPRANHVALSPGSLLGPYEIVSALGQGGMEQVYKARDPRLKRLVALKRLPASATTDPSAASASNGKRKRSAALNHPHIVTIHSVEQADGQFFPTMELVDGRSLAEAMPRSGLLLDRLLKIAILVADAMAAAHHKALGIAISSPPTSCSAKRSTTGGKVLDFGLAKLANAPAVPDRQRLVQRFEKLKASIDSGELQTHPMGCRIG